MDDIKNIITTFVYNNTKYKVVSRLSETEYLCRPLEDSGELVTFTRSQICDTIGRFGRLLYG